MSQAKYAVGQKVFITKPANGNFWSSLMDNYDGKVKEIIKVYYNVNYGWIYELENCLTYMFLEEWLSLPNSVSPNSFKVGDRVVLNKNWYNDAIGPVKPLFDCVLTIREIADDGRFYTSLGELRLPYRFRVAQLLFANTETKIGYCNCQNPKVKKGFTGCAGGGKEFDYCENCENEVANA